MFDNSVRTKNLILELIPQKKNIVKIDNLL